MKVSTHVTVTMVLWAAASLSGLISLAFFDPGKASGWFLAVLYIVAFVWVFSLASLIGYFARIMLWKSGVKFELWRSARRQAILFGFFSVILLLLKRGGIFNPLTAILLLIIFVLMELYAGQ